MIKVDGLDDLLAKLDRLPRGIETKVLPAALGAGAKVIQGAINQNIDGLNIAADGKVILKESLRIKLWKSSDRSVVGASVRLQNSIKLKQSNLSRFQRSLTGSKVKRMKIRATGDNLATDGAWWWRWFEYGTAPRSRGVGGKSLDMSTTTVSRRAFTDVRGGERKATTYRRTTWRAISSRRASTGQIKPQPFIRPAIADSKDAAAQAVSDAVKAKLLKALER